MTRGWLGEQYEGGQCDPLCPFVRDCPSCAFRGGTVEPQQDSARPQMRGTVSAACDNGGSTTAPGVASTNTEGLAQPKL